MCQAALAYTIVTEAIAHSYHETSTQGRRNSAAVFLPAVLGKLCKPCTGFIHSPHRRGLERWKTAVRKGILTRN